MTQHRSRLRRGVAVDLKNGHISEPSIDELREAVFDGHCGAACPYGCEVEPDGYCKHGRPSWLLYYGLI